MTILVTGGAGFIGSATIRYLIDETEHSVVNVDALTYAGNLDSLKSVVGSHRYSFEQVDICDRAGVDQVFEKYSPTAVMHLAAESHVDRSIDGPEAFVHTNVFGTYNMLRGAHEYWQRLSETQQGSFRFLHISTDEVFGDLGGTNEFFTEETAYAPSSPYSATKAGSDHLVRAWQRTYGLPTLITNCSNNYGPFQFPEKLIPHMILNALSGKMLPIYGDGSQIRDWLYVDDHAKALCVALENGKVGETYTVGGHNEQRNLDVVNTICAILEDLVPRDTGVAPYDELITYVTDRPGHDMRYAIDATKIGNELGWTPEETFDSGLRKTIEWYLENEWWWRRVLDGRYRLERLGQTGEA